MKLYLRFYQNVFNPSGFANSVDLMIVKIIETIESLKTQDKKLNEIIIEINSNGGSSEHGIKAYNFLRSLDVNITIIGNGSVDSAAIMLFCAGNKRLSFSPTRFVMHQARQNADIRNFGFKELQEQALIVKRLNDDYIKVLNEYIKITELDEDNISIINERVYSSYVVDEKEALEIKLINKVIYTKYLKSDIDVIYLQITV